MPGSRIGSAPSGEKTSSDGTEKLAISGSQWMLVSRIAEYIRTLAQTLTNKTINLSNNTLSGTTAQFNTANSDGDFATLAGSEVLTNKTLTTPTIGSFANAAHDHDDAAGGGTLDEDALALTDVVTNNSSLTKHGFLPKLSGDSSLFLNGDGEWATTPAGGSVYDSDVIMQDITTNNADSDSHGFLLKLSMNTAHYLRADGSWQAPPAGGSVYDSDILFSDITTNNASISQHGFLPKLSGDSTEYLNGDGEWVTPAGGGISSGTSFPVGPSTDDLFYRTDRDLLYFYDGTRWLTVTLYEHHLATVDNISGTTNFLTSSVWQATYDVYVETLYASLYCASGLSGSAYWALNLYFFDGATQGSIIATVNDQNGSNATYERKTASVNALMGTSIDAVVCVFQKLSTPGNLWAGAFLTYRLVG